jgi:hypothetical protein
MTVRPEHDLCIPRQPMRTLYPIYIVSLLDDFEKTSMILQLESFMIARSGVLNKLL